MIISLAPVSAIDEINFPNDEGNFYNEVNEDYSSNSLDFEVLSAYRDENGGTSHYGNFMISKDITGESIDVNKKINFENNLPDDWHVYVDSMDIYCYGYGDDKVPYFRLDLTDQDFHEPYFFIPNYLDEYVVKISEDQHSWDVYEIELDDEDELVINKDSIYLNDKKFTKDKSITGMEYYERNHCEILEIESHEINSNKNNENVIKITVKSDIEGDEFYFNGDVWGGGYDLPVFEDRDVNLNNYQYNNYGYQTYIQLNIENSYDNYGNLYFAEEENEDLTFIFDKKIIIDEINPPEGFHARIYTDKVPCNREGEPVSFGSFTSDLKEPAIVNDLGYFYLPSLTDSYIIGIFQNMATENYLYSKIELKNGDGLRIDGYDIYVNDNKITNKFEKNWNDVDEFQTCYKLSGNYDVVSNNCYEWEEKIDNICELKNPDDDTDGDGYKDKVEVRYRSNPLEKDDTPHNRIQVCACGDFSERQSDPYYITRFLNCNISSSDQELVRIEASNKGIVSGVESDVKGVIEFVTESLLTSYRIFMTKLVPKVLTVDGMDEACEGLGYYPEDFNFDPEEVDTIRLFGIIYKDSFENISDYALEFKQYDDQCAQTSEVKLYTNSYIANYATYTLATFIPLESTKAAKISKFAQSLKTMGLFDKVVDSSKILKAMKTAGASDDAIAAAIKLMQKGHDFDSITDVNKAKEIAKKTLELNEKLNAESFEKLIGNRYALQHIERYNVDEIIEIMNAGGKFPNLLEESFVAKLGSVEGKKLSQILEKSKIGNRILLSVDSAWSDEAKISLARGIEKYGQNNVDEFMSKYSDEELIFIGNGVDNFLKLEEVSQDTSKATDLFKEVSYRSFSVPPETHRDYIDFFDKKVNTDTILLWEKNNAQYEKFVNKVESASQDTIKSPQYRLKELNKIEEKIYRDHKNDKPKVTLLEYRQSVLMGTGKTMNDVIGARLMVLSLEDQNKLTNELKEFLKVPDENIKDFVEKPSEKGYRAKHLIVELDDGIKAEIQVKTLIQTLWGEWDHDLFYKGPYKDNSRAIEYSKDVSDALYLYEKGDVEEFIPPKRPYFVAKKEEFEIPEILVDDLK